jgi:hypothetical protein
MLLDGSGSMAYKWTDTLGSINGYVESLPSETEVYLAIFRSGYRMDDVYNVIRNEPVASFKPLTVSEVQADGGTPLLDSMACLLDTAFNDNPERAYVVIMTDGEENSSRNTTKDTVKEKLKRAEDRNWEVIFLGADFDAVHCQSFGLGLGVGKSLNMSTANYSNELKNLATHTVAYSSAGTRTVFTDEDQKRATKK